MRISSQFSRQLPSILHHARILHDKPNCFRQVMQITENVKNTCYEKRCK